MVFAEAGKKVWDRVEGLGAVCTEAGRIVRSIGARRLKYKGKAKENDNDGGKEWNPNGGPVNLHVYARSQRRK